jgi:hypothetical protein
MDNLFLILYNDLRLYTAMKEEESKYKYHFGTVEADKYKKTGAEWELFGDVCVMLERHQDSIHAYSLCLDQKTSPSALLKQLKEHIYFDDLMSALAVITELVAMGEQTFTQHTYPSSVGRAIIKLVHMHGLIKVQNSMIAMNIPQPTYKAVV